MQRHPPAKLLPISLLLGLLLGGCATMSGPSGVSVTVIDVVPTQTSLLEMSAQLRLRLTNESPLPLVLAGSAHRLYVNGSYVGRAVSNERVTVPPLGTATQAVTLYLENLTLVRKIAELSNAPAPRISYRLESKLHPADGERLGSIATTSTGELDLSGLASVVTGPGRAP